MEIISISYYGNKVTRKTGNNGRIWKLYDYMKSNFFFQGVIGNYMDNPLNYKSL